jgi:hypothetical protein
MLGSPPAHTVTVDWHEEERPVMEEPRKAKQKQLSGRETAEQFERLREMPPESRVRIEKAQQRLRQAYPPPTSQKVHQTRVTW